MCTHTDTHTHTVVANFLLFCSAFYIEGNFVKMWPVNSTVQSSTTNIKAYYIAEKWIPNSKLLKIALFDPFSKKFLVALFGVTTVSGS